MSTLGYHADENQTYFSRPMLMLGEIHWHLLRATHFEEEQQSVKGGSLLDILEEMANSGREFIGDEIHWWVLSAYRLGVVTCTVVQGNTNDVAPWQGSWVPWRDEILRAKGNVKGDNLDFLGELYRFVHRSDEPNGDGATLADVYYDLKFWRASP
jgi:hypothetical protein